MQPAYLVQAVTLNVRVVIDTVSVGVHIHLQKPLREGPLGHLFVKADEWHQMHRFVIDSDYFCSNAVDNPNGIGCRGR